VRPAGHRAQGRDPAAGPVCAAVRPAVVPLRVRRADPAAPPDPARTAVLDPPAARPVRAVVPGEDSDPADRAAVDPVEALDPREAEWEAAADVDACDGIGLTAGPIRLPFVRVARIVVG
jgi:hypothetical protein